MADPLEFFLAGVLVVAIIAYALLGGADFGGGMWDLFAFGPRSRQQREVIDKAIGPIWEANHVWLILLLVVSFTAFAPAFSAIMTALNIPLTVALVGIVLRGAAFIFRRYGSHQENVYRGWSRVFGVASLVTPFTLGICLAAVATGKIRLQNGVVNTGFFAGWTTPFALACGAFALGLFAFLAATYLTLEARENPALQNDFRLRALLSGLMLAPLAALVFALASAGAPYVFAGLTSWWAPPLLIATSAFSIATLISLWTRRFRLARITAIAQVSLILLGWGLAQYPFFLVPDLTIAQAAAPVTTLTWLAGALVVGFIILIPSLFYLFYIFKRTQSPFAPGVRSADTMESPDHQESEPSNVV